MKNKHLSKLIKIAVLSAMAFIIMFIEFPLPLFPEFLKIDLSDVPALLGTFSMGPLAGVLIELIKNLLHSILAGKTAGVGELANLVVGAAFVISAGMIYKRERSKKSALISIGVGIIVMGIVASLGNMYVFLPLYEKVLHFPINAAIAMGGKLNGAIVDLKTFIVFSILPFNIIKGVIEGFLTFIMYKKVSTILHK